MTKVRCGSYLALDTGSASTTQADGSAGVGYVDASCRGSCTKVFGVDLSAP